MITTAVQQASQIVEIQGAPATVQAAGDDFRATFAANVSAPVTQKSGQSQKDQGSNLAAAPSATSLVKQAITTALSVKSASDSPNQNLPQITDATKDEDASQQAIENASSSNLKTGAGSALNTVATDSSTTGNDLRWAVLTPVGDETPGLATTVTPPPRAASESTSASKQEHLSESTEVAAAKGGKTAAPDVKKALSLARAETIASDTSPVPATDQAQLNTNVPVVVTATPPSSHVTATAFDRPPNSGAVSATTPLSNTGPKSAQIIDGPPQLAVEVGAATTKALTTTAASSAVPDTGIGPQLKVKDTSNASGSETTETKVAVPSSAPAGAAASQRKAVPYSGPAVQTAHAAQTSSSKTVGSVQDPSLKIQDSEPAGEPKLTSTGVSLTDGTPVPVQAAVNAALQVGVAQPPSASVRGGSTKVEAAATKDTKAKASADEAGDAAATTSATLLGDTPSLVSSAAAPVGSVTGRLIAAVETVMPAAVATPHTAGATAHVTTADTASTVAARVQGSVNAGSAVTEAASSSTQVGDSHRTLLATPTTLEVGVQSGTQGWLRIRAEVGDQGAVNASLAAGTNSGRELLHTQMPALNAFLHSEQMAVTTTVVDRGSLASGSGVATGSGGLGTGDGSGANGSLLQGGDAQSDGVRQDSSPRSMGLTANDSASSYDLRSGVSGTEGASASRTTISAESGRWLNVRV